MKKLIGIVGIALLAISCKTKHIVQPSKTVTNTIEKTVTVNTRDTVFEVEADSSFYQAWIECRDGKPVLRNPTSRAGKDQLKPPKIKLADDGQLDVECATENLELKARINDLITELNTTASTIEYIPVEVEKELTFIQTLFIKLGKIFGLILLGAIGYGAYKLVLKYYVRK